MREPGWRHAPPLSLFFFSGKHGGVTARKLALMLPHAVVKPRREEEKDVRSVSYVGVLTRENKGEDAN